MATQPDFDPRPAEQVFSVMVRRYGSPAPASKRLDIQAPVADDGETDCWTHAWKVARKIGGHYVEGICRRGKGLAQHAWVEEDTPFGPRLVETTPGYEDAFGYVGIAVDCSRGGDVDRATRDWGRIRSSVIQASIASGFTPAQVMEQVKPR